MMGRTLPPGVLGLVVASLLAAFMSTIDTHTNWGASYLVQDLYSRFLVNDADPRHYVLVSRICVVLMAALAGLASLFIHDIASVWRFLLTLGAGLGSISAARWYWSRVTPYAEFAALGISTALAIGLEVFFTPTIFGGPNPWFITALPAWQKILIIAFASLGTWIPVALWGPRNKDQTLRRFASKVRPPGPSWAPYRSGPTDPIKPAVLRFAAGLVVVFGTLFGTGNLLLGNVLKGTIEVAAAVVLLLWIVRSGGVGLKGVGA
jgi:Na+/proline symporter